MPASASGWQFQDAPAEPRYAGIRREEVELHLQWHDAADFARSPEGSNYRFAVDDVDALHAELSAQGYAFDMKPVSDTASGTREFHLRDPDRNGLQFYRAR